MPLSLHVNNEQNIYSPTPSEVYPVRFLKSWENGLKRANFSLIHGISSNKASPLRQRSANLLLSEWDIISCSLVDYANRGDITFSTAAKGAHPLHLELDVPVQNILGTHVKDVAFPNHVGRKWSSPTGNVLDKAALTRHIFNGIDKFSCKIDAARGFNQLMHFQDFILKGFRSSAMGYNEILLIGRPDVNFYNGLPCTREIKVTGISYVPAHLLPYSSAVQSGSGIALKKMMEQIEKDVQALCDLSKVNNIKQFTNRLYNSRGECFSVLNDILTNYFGQAERGVYNI